MTARDSFGNTVTSFSGAGNTVDISSNRTCSAGCSTTGAFSNGVLTGYSVTLSQSGTLSTITATRTSGGAQTGTSNTFTVNAAGLNNFLVEANGGGNIATQTAGTPFLIQVTARDTFGNTVTSFSGAGNTVDISSNRTCSAGCSTTGAFSNGVLTGYSVTLSQSGTLSTITATRTSGGAQTGTSNTFTVNPGALDHITISPSSATITAGGTQSYTSEAFDQYGNLIGDVTFLTFFSMSPDGSCVANVCGSTVSGDHTVTGTFSGKSDDADLQIDAAALDHITVSPATATITAGDTQSYTVEAFDQYGNSRGDVTGSTTFTVAPDGSCVANACGSTISGDHTVTGTFSGKSDDADLQIDAAALDHITVSPATATITAGGTQSYTVEAFDQYGNSRGDVTGSTTFTVAPDGSCVANACGSTISGDHTVTGTFSGKSDDADLQIDAAALDHITVSPASATITAGGTQSYTVEAFDQYNNSRGDVTGSTTFTISPGRLVQGAKLRLDASRVTTPSRAPSRASQMTPICRSTRRRSITSPCRLSTATITAGGTQSYTVEAFDQYNNSKGDVTGSTSFSISPDGSCSGADCGSSTSGDHTVTGTYLTKSDDADLQIDAAALDHITVSPSSATITAGGTQSYTSEAFDQYGNLIGDVTFLTFFSMSPDGSCVANVCGSTVSGDHTVTGTFSGKSDDADLQIDAAALDHITVSPASGDDHGGRYAELHRGGVRPVRQLAWGRDRFDVVHGRPGRLLCRQRVRLDDLG